MKEKYSVDICGMRLTLVSDESEEYVNSIVATLNKRVNDLVMTNLRCTKIDALLLCTLDYLDEKTKIQLEAEELRKELSECEEKLAAAETELEELKKGKKDLDKRSKNK